MREKRYSKDMKGTQEEEGENKEEGGICRKGPKIGMRVSK